MKISEIREKNLEQLGKMLDEKTESARKLRFETASKQAKDTRGIRNLKRDIARILTIIKEKKTDGK